MKQTLPILITLFLLTNTAFAQIAPDADAGPDQVAMDTNGGGTAQATLSAEATIDVDGDVLTFTWQAADGTTVGQGETLTLTLPVGRHTFTLVVNDGTGLSDTDITEVFVGAALATPLKRISINGGKQSLFMNGINLAWNNYGEDVINLDEAFFAMVFDSLQNAGANGLRWWLHPNGRVNPLFNSDGTVREYHPNMVPNVRKVLDMAWQRGVTVSLCLWSFDMLQDQGQDQQMMKMLLEDSVKTQTYIDNALNPLLDALGSHPAVMTFEIFNEAEGMTDEFGWTPVKTTMAHVQAFVNRVAGAVHRRAPQAMVSTGVWNMRAMTDVDGFFNYYRDDRLIAAGGDPDGTLDFYQVHFYPDNFTNEVSPFHRPASYWQVNKPIVIGEYPVRTLEGLIDPEYTTTETYQLAHAYGYAGAMPWTFVNFDGGNFLNAREGMRYLADNFPQDVLVDNSAPLNQVPQVVAGIPFANAKLGQQVVIDGHVDLNTVFLDPEDGTNLAYSIDANSDPLLVQPEIDNNGLVTLALVEGEQGTANIRIKATDTEGASAWATLTVNVYDPQGNLALFAPIVASTVEDDNQAGVMRLPEMANDGNDASRWSSQYADDQWLAVDLGALYLVNRVVLHWEVAFGQSYTIQLSKDSTTWFTATSITNGAEGVNNHPFDSAAARYVRIDCHTRGTEFGFSLWEVQVFGEPFIGDAVTGLQEVSRQLRAWPNPTAGSLQVSLPGQFSVQLLSANGQQVLPWQTANGQAQVNMAHLPAGLYLLQVQTKRGRLTRRIVRQ